MLCVRPSWYSESRRIITRRRRRPKYPNYLKTKALTTLTAHLRHLVLSGKKGRKRTKVSLSVSDTSKYFEAGGNCGISWSHPGLVGFILSIPRREGGSALSLSPERNHIFTPLRRLTLTVGSIVVRAEVADRGKNLRVHFVVIIIRFATMVYRHMRIGSDAYVDVLGCITINAYQCQMCWIFRGE